MSKYLVHIDPDLPEDSGQWLASVSKKEGFQVPENYFAASELHIVSLAELTPLRNEMNTEFVVPEKYFDTLQTTILAKADELSARVDDDFFVQQQNQIVSRINLEVISESSGKKEFNVPENYFESAQNNITSAVLPREDRTPVIPLKKSNKIRFLTITSVAASIAALLFFNFPDKPATNQSFAELLQNTELDDNDLDYIITEPEDIELIVDDIIEVYKDSTDSTSAPALTKPLEIKPKLDPKTGLPIKDQRGIKPSDKKNDLKLDELSEEEIMNFLLEDGGDDILNELN
jgi:hypothetical protein